MISCMASTLKFSLQVKSRIKMRACSDWLENTGQGVLQAASSGAPGPDVCTHAGRQFPAVSA